DAYEGNFRELDGNRDGVCAFEAGLSKDRGVSEVNEVELIFGSVRKKFIVNGNVSVGISSNIVNHTTISSDGSMNNNDLGVSGNDFILEMHVPFDKNPILNPDANVIHNDKSSKVSLNGVKVPG
ncbi:hypothetical protein Tco_0259420, partial [Tanacetum coccineum]